MRDIFKKKWCSTALVLLIPIGVLAYVSLLYFVIWLYFIDEIDFRGSFVVGIVLLFGGAALLGIGCDTKPSNIILKMLTKASKIIGIIICFISVLMMIFPFLGLPIYFGIYSIFMYSHSLILIGAIWMLLIIILILTCRYMSKTFLVYPIFRTLCYISFRYFCLYVFIISIFCLIYKQNIDLDLAHTLNIDANSVDEYGIVFLIAMCIVLSFMNMEEKIYFVTIPKLKYNFFLRPFNKDTSLKIDKEIISNFPEELVEIADPMSKKGNEKFSGKGFFLPTNNWKKELSYYIKKAKYVFCCIGMTDGVKWEMFEHDEISDKFIFYFDGKTPIKNIVQNVSHTNQKDSKVFSVLTYLQNIDLNHSIYFTIKNNKCFYTANLSDIASFLNNQITPHTLNSFVFEYNKNHKKNEKSRNTKFKYFFKDIIRLFNTIFGSKSLNAIVIVASGLLYGCLILFWFIVSIGFILLGLASLISLISPSIRDWLGFDESSKETLKFGIFGIVVGVYFLKLIFDKD